MQATAAPDEDSWGVEPDIQIALVPQEIYKVGKMTRDAEVIRSAAAKAVEEGWTRYTPVPGVPALRAAVAEQVSKSRGVAVTPKQVIITCGAVVRERDSSE